MALIKSISGIRGTIGGQPGQSLTPIDVVKFVSAYAKIIFQENNKRIVVGRDGRISGAELEKLVTSTLYFLGAEVITAGLTTTPSLEMAVTKNEAAGGIILTASHNPKQWNALKLLNDKGEFISAEQGQQLLELSEADDFLYADIENLGSVWEDDTVLAYHIEKIIDHPLVKPEAVAKRNFKIAIDGINSTGAMAIPQLLRSLGISDQNIELLNEEINGEFAHDPEPLDQNLTQIKALCRDGDYDLGIVVDPDVDRLCFVDENGELFGEEYTLVAIADYLLTHSSENKISVSNMSSSRALKDVTEKHGGQYYSSMVGEVNVVATMKEKDALIGGEGNGGVIDPSLHYGRDALVGIALFLSFLVEKNMPVSELRASYPNYVIIKNKIPLTPEMDVQQILSHLKSKFSQEDVDDRDGLKIIFPDGNWVQLRASNTEPILRLYAEAESKEEAQKNVDKITTAMKS